VASETQQKVAGNAYPGLYGEVGKFVQGWDFMNLLGAMWLQMFWLLTASETPRRCRNWECDKVIAYEQPEPLARVVKKNDRSGGYKNPQRQGVLFQKMRQPLQLPDADETSTPKPGFVKPIYTAPTPLRTQHHATGASQRRENDLNKRVLHLCATLGNTPIYHS
jgi:hypothetical protein